MNAKNTENGFLYIATGRKFVEEAKASVASLKQHMPNASTCCFTDDVEGAAPYFDQVFKIAEPYRNFFEKIPPLKLTPFKNTIFIDTDTYFTGDMSDVFDLLARFEIAVAGDPFFCGFKEIPQCFTHLNTGLIAYRKSEALNAFFDSWFNDYESTYKLATNKKRCHDQISFQRALYNSTLQMYVLPPEYNLRMTCPQAVRIWAPVKMIHARHPDLKSLGERLNGNGEFKVIWPNFSHFCRSKMHFLGIKQDRFLGILLSILKWPMGLYPKRN